MSRPKYSARIDNIYFLSPIGLSLRWATQDKPHEDLPANVRQLLARLDRWRPRPMAGRPAAVVPIDSTAVLGPGCVPGAREAA